MRVLLHGRHRYPARRGEGSGLEPRSRPSDALDHLLDLLARGLAEKGHEVNYLLPAGADGPLPEGVRRASSPIELADVAHNLEIPGVPWVVTVHAERAAAVYYDRYERGSIVSPPTPEALPPELPANAICVSRSLASSLGGSRYVHNGIDPAEYVYSETKEDYLLFMAGMQGPTVPDMYRAKGLEDALGAARETGIELVVAGTTRERAVGERIRELCGAAGARYLGDIRGGRKAELLAGARALLFPTRINEGFGLVMAEALMSGTPVIASDCGACPELIDPDVGFVCADADAFRAAIENLDSISPAECRAKAMREYHYRRMAAGYVREYQRELERVAAPA
jgi:glycosyltransferase involved in cell wall biosynthesis